MHNFKNSAACEGTDTEQWFSKDSGEYMNERLLFRICQGCPARGECLEYSLHNKVLGYWAGTTERKRKMIRRQLGITAKPVLPEWELNRRGA
jgi:hypothetical protein